MSEGPQIDAKPSEVRPVYRRPLDNPRTLTLGVIFFAVTSVGAAWAAHSLGTFWAALLPIPCAVALGIALAGLFPNWWFGRDN